MAPAPSIPRQLAVNLTAPSSYQRALEGVSFAVSAVGLEGRDKASSRSLFCGVICKASFDLEQLPRTLEMAIAGKYLE